MAEYEMEILWKKGSEMQHVDFFSRQIEPEEGLEERMVYDVNCDPEPFLPTIEDVLNEQKKTTRPTGRGYVTRGDVTYYRNGVWVPFPLQQRIVSACHLLPPFCHSGVKKTKSTILKVFNWSGLHKDVTKYVRGCLFCNDQGREIERLQGIMHPHPIPVPLKRFIWMSGNAVFVDKQKKF